LRFRSTVQDGLHVAIVRAHGLTEGSRGSWHIKLQMRCRRKPDNRGLELLHAFLTLWTLGNGFVPHVRADRRRVPSPMWGGCAPPAYRSRAVRVLASRSVGKTGASPILRVNEALAPARGDYPLGPSGPAPRLTTPCAASSLLRRRAFDSRGPPRRRSRCRSGGMARQRARDSWTVGCASGDTPTMVSITPVDAAEPGHARLRRRA
jgi:hypothetical protein